MSENEVNRFTDDVILQHYRVTMAHHELSAIEMRIMAMVVLKLKDAQLNGYNEDVRDMPDLFNKFNEVTINNADITVGSNHSQVKKALKDLRARDITLKTMVNGKSGELYTGLIREAKYSDDSSTIKIDLSPDLLPELVAIGKNYTKFGLKFLFKTKSTHAIRWYQIGSHWLNKGVFYISKNEIRDLFKAKNKYKVHKDFQRRLVTEPFDEVNKNADINLKICETHKKGRTIEGYTISVTQKSQVFGKNTTNPEDIPPMLVSYISRYWNAITHYAKKTNYDHLKISDKLKQRGIPENIKNQRHFDNSTNKFIATILTKDGATSLTIEQLLKEIKSW